MVRSLSEKPVINKGTGKRSVVRTVGRGTEGERLPLALRDDAIGGWLEDVLDGEVRELETEGTGKSRRTIAERGFDLIRGFGLEVVVDVNRSVFRVRLDVRNNLFGVKEAHLRHFTHGAHDVALGVKLTGLGAKFTTNDVLINTVVAVDAYPIDGRLPAFIDSHFVVDAVRFDIDFDGFNVGEEIAIVLVEVGDGILIIDETVLEQFGIVGIARGDAQPSVEFISGIERVANPVDGTDVVFVAFRNGDEDIDTVRLVRRRANGVSDDDGITESTLVVAVNDVLLVGLIEVLDELFGTEDVFQFTSFIGFLHRLVETTT